MFKLKEKKKVEKLQKEKLPVLREVWGSGKRRTGGEKKLARLHSVFCRWPLGAETLL